MAPPHIALLAGAGVGHLFPIIRLASALSLRNCTVTLITAEPTVSNAEAVLISSLLSSHPNINSVNLPLTQLADVPPNADPFVVRYEALALSAPSLPSLLSSLNVSALVIDISVAYAYIRVANSMNLPCFVNFTSCAAMLLFLAYYPTKHTSTIPSSCVPSPLRDPNHLFAKQFAANAEALPNAAGILVNTFASFEPEALSALARARDEINLPVAIPIYPQLPFSLNQQSSSSSAVQWLDQQPDKSVVYVSFGNRTAMTGEQIKELAVGLEKSECRFLWVLKTKVVDKEEEKNKMEEVLGEGYLERVKGKGMVVNEFVDQEEVLGHRAVGGFLSHAGPNSVLEAAMKGVRVLGWPRGGDQRVSGLAMRRGGLGVWMEEWSWENDKNLVLGEEIGRRVKEFMADEELEMSARKVGEEAAKAAAEGGSLEMGLKHFISLIK